MLAGANIEQGSSEKMELTFLHVLRGGSMQLAQLGIAPVVGIVAGGSPKLRETFFSSTGASGASTKMQAEVAAKIAAAHAKNGLGVVTPHRGRRRPAL